RRARAGSPGAGYCLSNSALGKEAPKSWMVRGRAMAVTAVTLVSQWAEMARIALGRGSAAAISPQARLVLSAWIATIGLPWPKKATGIRDVIRTTLRRAWRA